MQLSDIDIEKMLPQFSLRSMGEINEILTEQRARPESRVAQRTLARELTELLHGEESAVAAEQATNLADQAVAAVGTGQQIGGDSIGHYQAAIAPEGILLFLRQNTHVASPLAISMEN
jgi:hypothetical protein